MSDHPSVLTAEYVFQTFVLLHWFTKLPLFLHSVRVHPSHSRVPCLRALSCYVKVSPLTNPHGYVSQIPLYGNLYHDLSDMENLKQNLFIFC